MSGAVTNILTFREAEKYKRLKSFVKQWVSDRFEAGAALATIRAEKLYRTEYKTFEEFCKAEYDIVPTHAYRLIEAANIKKSPNGSQVTCERQARALAAVPEEKRGEVLAKAGAGGKVTARSIERAAGPVIDVDSTGVPIPSGILEDWNRADEIGRELTGLVSKVKCKVEEGLASDDPIWTALTNVTVVDLKNAFTGLGELKPHGVCPVCQARQRKGCRLCKGRGFVSERLYKLAPEETRRLREKKK